MKNNFYYFLLISFFLLAPALVLGTEAPPQFISEQNIGEESDAIAVRVLPNPNHYSAERWYKSQGFSGSPQSLLVDGYDAVRDGRTVYVNAANVDLNNNIIYTNIYLISYAQSSLDKTVDVLGQIVKNWRFNSNLNEVGKCHISTLLCERDSDCSQDNTCFKAVENAPGRCRPVEQDSCYTDSDCAAGIYCDSLRAKVTRDVRRLGSLGNLREALSAFRQTNGRYPVLASGSYIPLNSVSVWPSWQSSLLPQIGASQASVDPINSLGACPGHDSITCWNQTTSSFADPNPSNDELELPANSYAFTYESDANGANYSLCASMETKDLGYNTAEGQLAELGCIASGTGYVGSSDNQAPVLMNANLQGEQDQVFSGFIRVIDPENNALNWSINTNSVSWTGWSDHPVLQDTANPNQKRIYALKAGSTGIYNLPLTVSDSYGGTLSTITPITIINNPPFIQADDVDYYPNVNLPLTLRFSVSDKHHPLSYSLAKAQHSSGPHDLLSPANATLLNVTSNRVGDTVNYSLKYNILTSAANKFPVDTNFVYVITARDRYNVSSTRQININVKADPPALDFNCAKNVRVGADYYCGLGWGKQGDHTITYSAVGALPAGLNIDEADNLISPDIPEETSRKNIFQKIASIFKNINYAIIPDARAVEIRPFYVLKGVPTTAALNFPIKIKAENEFGAASNREFDLNINDYCGDGIKQQPNMEGRGGFYNDGNEDCDGNEGIITSAAQIIDSNSNFQYGCTTKANANTPYPIPNHQYFCTFSDADYESGGGFCGDGICQSLLNRNGVDISWENINNCSEDCTHEGEEGGRGDDDTGEGDDTGRGNDGPDDNLGCGEMQYEGQTYQTTMIGSQCWMAENLNVGTRINASANQGSQVTIQKYCYDNLESNCNIYGGLYQWDTIRKGASLIDSQGICPDGWHIPRDYEWHTLESYLATTACSADRFGLGCNPAGETLKNDEFAALLSGYYDKNSGFRFQGSVERFWTSNHRLSPSESSGEQGGNYPYIRELDSSTGVNRLLGQQFDAYPLRCVQD
jgi:uncharacterized protein (TIGR02145 family)